MSVLWLTPPLVPVTCKTYVPVEAVDVVVNPMGELASPPEGGVTLGGRFIPIPDGALPTHAAENVIGALNPFIDCTATEVPPPSPGIVDTVSDVGVMLKSGPFTATAGVTGASTTGAPAITTGIVVVWTTTPLDAVTTRL